MCLVSVPMPIPGTVSHWLVTLQLLLTAEPADVLTGYTTQLLALHHITFNHIVLSSLILTRATKC